MRLRSGLGKKLAVPEPREYPEIEGVILNDQGKDVLACPDDWHKVGTVHDGHVLKIRDRRCKKDLTFELGRIAARKTN